MFGLNWVKTLALVALLAIGSGCTRRTAVQTNVLNIGNGGEVKDLDPHITTGVPESHVILNLFEGLVDKDPKTLEIIPGAAESFTISKDAKTYTFKIRPSAKWSNGDPLTAADFVYSWTRLLDPKTAAEYAFMAWHMVGAKEYTEGKEKDASKLGFKALDIRTLQVQLKNPTPFFLKLLYHHSLYPVHRASIEKLGTQWTRPENMVSNGAFVLDKWVMNKVISLKPNPHYWNRKLVVLDGVNFYPVEKQETEEKMFRAGELHVTNELAIDKIDYWEKDKSGAFQKGPFLATYYYWINTAKPPLNDKRVRRALALAVDRTKLVKYVTKGGQLPGVHLVPPGVGENYQPIPRLPADDSKLAEAKQLLKEAGFPDGKGAPPIDLLYNTSENHKKIAEALQQMWNKGLGLNVQLFNQEWKVYLNSQQSKNFMLSRAGWVGDYNDPNTFLDMFVTGQGVNYSNWGSKKFDGLIEAAAKETNVQKRLTIFNQAEDIILDELPIIPLYIYTRVFLLNPDVQGYYNNIEDIHPVKWVRIGKSTQKL